jgi:hypothetical protein
LRDILGARKRIVKQFVTFVAVTPRDWHARKVVRIDSLFPYEFWVMFRLLCAKRGYEGMEMFKDKDEFTKVLETVFREHEINCFKAESKSDFNIRKGPFRYCFTNLRFYKRGYDLLYEMYDFIKQAKKRKKQTSGN